ncbi:MAG: HAMP domain-containing sensor histidine kinase [Candidatus Altiarchaeota archaeon]
MGVTTAPAKTKEGIPSALMEDVQSLGASVEVKEAVDREIKAFAKDVKTRLKAIEKEASSLGDELMGGNVEKAWDSFDRVTKASDGLTALIGERLERARRKPERQNNDVFSVNLSTGVVVSGSQSSSERLGWSTGVEVDATFKKKLTDGAMHLMGRPSVDVQLEEDNLVQLLRVDFPEGKPVAMLVFAEPMSESQKAVIHELGDFAHDLKNPMQGFNTAMPRVMEALSTGDTTTAGEWLAHISKTSERLSGIVEDRLECLEGAEKKRMVFSVSNTVYDASRMYSKSLTQSGIDFSSEVDRDLLVYGNRSDIRTVFVNLIENSIPPLLKVNGERRISVTSEKVKFRDADAMKITFSDNGEGSDDDTERWFERGYTTKGRGGTGIGLAKSKIIIEEEMGGSITVVSKRGKGTTFTIIVPLAESRMQMVA